MARSFKVSEKGRDQPRRDVHKRRIDDRRSRSPRRDLNPMLGTHLLKVIAALGLTQIVGYGTLYYSFSILAPSIAAELGWSTQWVFGAFSAALLLGGLAAPFAGRWIDRHGAAHVMAMGSLAAALALGLCALPVGPVGLVLGLIATQLAANLVQYSAAFSLLVQARPIGAQRSITHLTLIAGFASTLFWPLTTVLQAHLSWHIVYLVFALLHLGLCLPIHLWLGRTARSARTSAEDTPSMAPPHVVEGILPVAERRWGFRWMVLGFALESFVNSALLVHMLPLLGALGLGAAGVLVGSLFGPAQVMSRFVNMVFGGRLPQVTLALISAVLLPAAIALLLATTPWLAGGLAFAVVFGLGSGLSSIVQGTLPLALFGSAGYAERLGRVTSVRLAVSSTAPFMFALMTNHLEIGWSLALTGILGTGAVIAFLQIAKETSSRRPAAA